MEIKLAKQILTEAVDLSLQRGVFNLSQAKNCIDALEVVLNQPEIESMGIEPLTEETESED